MMKSLTRREYLRSNNACFATTLCHLNNQLAVIGLVVSAYETGCIKSFVRLTVHLALRNTTVHGYLALVNALQKFESASMCSQIGSLLIYLCPSPSHTSDKQDGIPIVIVTN